MPPCWLNINHARVIALGGGLGKEVGQLRRGVLLDELFSIRAWISLQWGWGVAKLGSGIIVECGIGSRSERVKRDVGLLSCHLGGRGSDPIKNDFSYIPFLD